jgi:dTDP-glucose pyrophosphorylase
MWGLIPAAGYGTRIQPLAFSKELLPVGSRLDGLFERPRAVSEYLVERMIIGGANKICMIVSPEKSDIIKYFGTKVDSTAFCYVVQQKPGGLCDALFSAVSFLPQDEHVLIGLPDTIWFPENGFTYLPDDILSFLLFPVEHPELFDSVVLDKNENVLRVDVKTVHPESSLIWGAFKMKGKIFHDLYNLWLERNRIDEYFGTLTNAYIQKGGSAKGFKAGESYVDVGTINGYREAINLLIPQREGRTF